jgi:muramoyltetrapeptide carboxypeptidase
VAALSGPVEEARLERGLAALEALGFVPVPAANLRQRSADGLFAGGDAQRLEAFHALAADPSVEAIFFARGGHGLVRLLPRLDWELLAARPRAYVGYSDLTPFLLQVVRRLGLVAFHGPMVAADLARGLDPVEERSLLSALAGRYPCDLPLAGGEGEPAEGILLGGCLSLLTATLGTEFAPDLTGALLFLEDVGEPAYRLDRMLTHLALAHKLAFIHGIVLGQIGGCANTGETPPRLLQGLASPEGRLPWPWGWGLEAGHEGPNRTLPLGLPARLDPGRRSLLLGIV